MSFNSNMDLINELFDISYDEDNDIDNDVIDKDKYYFIGKAESILLELSDEENYYNFLKIMLKDYNKLSTEHKTEIIKQLNIDPNKEKIIVKYVNKSSKKPNKKPKLNLVDDY